MFWRAFSIIWAISMPTARRVRGLRLVNSEVHSHEEERDWFDHIGCDGDGGTGAGLAQSGADRERNGSSAGQSGNLRIRTEPPGAGAIHTIRAGLAGFSRAAEADRGRAVGVP